MPIPTQVYKCSICLTPHDSFERAAGCESMGLPLGSRLPIGSVIGFECENENISTWSYTTENGIVLFSFAVLDNKHKVHRWAHIVKPSRLDFNERLVFQGANGFFSTAEAQYNTGFADCRRNEYLKYQNVLMYPIQY